MVRGCGVYPKPSVGRSCGAWTLTGLLRERTLPTMPPLLRILPALLAIALLLAPGAARADGAILDDEDIDLASEYFGLHLGSNVATAVFGTASLAMGIENFVITAQGENHFFLALTLTSMGVASVVSAATGADGNVRRWKAQQASYRGASPAERRLIREAEAARLKRVAVNRGIGLAADGTFLGLGVALLFIAPSDLGIPLVLNGAFLLGLDIFRLIVDDQTAQRWLARNRAADAGYFTARSPPRITGFGAAPIALPDGAGGVRVGGSLAIGGVF